MGKVVLVTGVAGDLWRRFALQLAESPDVDRVIGIDLSPPHGDHSAINFIRIDIRNPVIAKVIARERVDTVVHTTVVSSDAARVGRAALKELNVIGSMQLLAACQQAPHLRRLVMKSSGAFYGASPRDPAMFTEDMTAKSRIGSGYAKDIVEVESYLRGFARRRPDVEVTTLRFANAVGPSINSALTNYFRLPVVPTVLGFNPRLQFTHEDDLLAALHLATMGDVSGTFNVCGDGVLRLNQAVHRVGKPMAPMPAFAFSGLTRLIKGTKVADLSHEMVSFLTYGRGMDTTRMREVLGFEPTHTTESAFADFAASIAPGLLSPERIERVEGDLGRALRVAALNDGGAQNG
ncbi:MAG TPA: NAD-dependent epimerase/dehydratase family protein [Marmoricola sp.]|jgi:UDP-glucose 4-epimerase|nr:NAD-dependent epimerase/dehydratase family protein [Nocardioidaceae bacterium]MCB8992308.1 NAD-dependent epimerase/dehydratase family protein [Nocardioidaceae bacterium]MCO5323944.1 NAD-dependent epimerase/dehydratase family protein [Nocardioidaceae bacterium]HMY08728.1 NAD-dependent epimerase/dehydratase family protein [Marmoricola sp.]HRV68975.1 NAD-dependent epimerase/dehydratase family protein [Marmoricola sp.]